MQNTGVIDGSTANEGPETSLIERVLRKTGAAYLYQSSTLDILFSGNLPSTLKKLVTGDTPVEVLGQSQGERLLEMQRKVLTTGTADSMEIEIASTDGMLIYSFETETADLQGDTGLLSVITDISDNRHRERVMKTLLRELSHRSKNLLAIIQGIATQTARQALSLDAFLSAFRGRIQSLAFSQDLVTDSSWRGAFLATLTERQFSAYWPTPENPVTVAGIDAHLRPNAALHIGLALHELIVNSASHGAMAAGANSISIGCFETIYDGGKAIEVSWIEHMPPRPNAGSADEHTFARTVLERVVPIAIGGKAIYMTAPDRIEYRLTVPAREYEIITRASE